MSLYKIDTKDLVNRGPGECVYINTKNIDFIAPDWDSIDRKKVVWNIHTSDHTFVVSKLEIITDIVSHMGQVLNVTDAKNKVIEKVRNSRVKNDNRS